MAEAFSWEIRERAEDLHIVDGLTLEQTAQATGVALATLKKWSTDDNWSDKRREYRQALSQIKRNTVLLRKDLIAKALQSLDPQDVYAVSRLESATLKREKPEEGASSAGMQAGESRVIKTAADAVAALDEAINLKLNAMLIRPEAMTLAAIRDMKKAMELLDEIRAKYAPTDKAADRRGLSDETVDEIRKRILGIEG